MPKTSTFSLPKRTRHKQVLQWKIINFSLPKMSS